MMDFITYLFPILILLVILLALLYMNSRNKLRVLKEEYKQTLFDLRSSRVKHGKSWEHFVPFMSNYPGDKNNSVFLGMPIDFISFGDNNIKFIEVKTGKAKLNKKQKQIKDLVNKKQVEWHEVEYK